MKMACYRKNFTFRKTQHRSIHFNTELNRGSRPGRGL